MDSTIGQILRDFRIEDYLPIVSRDLDLGDALAPRRGNLVKVIIGMRRSGKSYRLLQEMARLHEDGITWKRKCYFKFEDDRLGSVTPRTGDALMEAFMEENPEALADGAYFFFDEIQEVQGWEKAVNSLRVKFHADIYITGSNSRLLSGELATYIAGRYIFFVVYPFSFTEFQMADPALTFNQYIQYGGMPFLSSINFEPEISKNYLQDIFNSMVLKDIVKRNNIRDVDLLERIIAYALANVGRSFSATSISKFFKAENRTVAPETILNYLKACEEAYLLYRFKRQDINGKKVLKVNEKYYVADHGLREAVIGSNLQNVEIILENIVGLELLRRGYKVCVGRVGTKEIDFVGEKQGDKLYVQVCYLLSDEVTIQREFGSLLEVRDNYPKIVLYQEGSFRGNYEGIPAMRIEDWLMDEGSKHGQ